MDKIELVNMEMFPFSKQAFKFLMNLEIFATVQNLVNQKI